MIAPVIEAHERPAKPPITSQFLKVGDKYYVAYEWPEAQRLYNYLVSLESHMDSQDLRLKIINQIIKQIMEKRL